MLVVGLNNVTASDNVFTHKVGPFEVILLSEGQGTGNSSIFVGATPEMIQRAVPTGTFPNSCNAFLVRMGNANILIDTGRNADILLENLKSAGVSPEQIHEVYITHVHGDHIGGLIKNDRAVFPNATLHLSQAEHDFAMNGEARNANARNMIEAYRLRLNLFEPKEIDDAQPVWLQSYVNRLVIEGGISAIAAYGHTPGHTMFMVEYGNEKLLIWGDLTHAMAIQMPYPQVAMTYDLNPEMAIAARKKVLEYVAANNITIAGMHIAFPGMGKITKTSDAGYTYTPVNF